MYQVTNVMSLKMSAERTHSVLPRSAELVDVAKVAGGTPDSQVPTP